MKRRPTWRRPATLPHGWSCSTEESCPATTPRCSPAASWAATTWVCRASPRSSIRSSTAPRRCSPRTRSASSTTPGAVVAGTTSTPRTSACSRSLSPIVWVKPGPVPPTPQLIWWPEWARRTVPRCRGAVRAVPWPPASLWNSPASRSDTGSSLEMIGPPWLDRAWAATRDLPRWFAGDGVITAHQRRDTYGYRGPHRRLQMTLDCLGKLVDAALALRAGRARRARAECRGDARSGRVDRVRYRSSSRGVDVSEQGPGLRPPGRRRHHQRLPPVAPEPRPVRGPCRCRPARRCSQRCSEETGCMPVGCFLSRRRSTKPDSRSATTGSRRRDTWNRPMTSPPSPGSAGSNTASTVARCASRRPSRSRPTSYRTLSPWPWRRPPTVPSPSTSSHEDRTPPP